MSISGFSLPEHGERSAYERPWQRLFTFTTFPPQAMYSFEDHTPLHHSHDAERQKHYPAVFHDPFSSPANVRRIGDVTASVRQPLSFPNALATYMDPADAGTRQSDGGNQT